MRDAHRTDDTQGRAEPEPVQRASPVSGPRAVGDQFTYRVLPVSLRMTAELEALVDDRLRAT